MATKKKSEAQVGGSDLMARIADANKTVVQGIDDSSVEHWVTIYVMGRAYKVPATLTIMQAMEYAGYRFVRSCGCRAGFCGACATVFRRAGEYKLESALACQTLVEDGIYLVQIPFAPAKKANYDLDKEVYDSATVFKFYPEVARCISCNTCTKSCPQDLQVMDYIQAMIRGDFEGVVKESFDCIQCGLCAIRCPAEIVQYHVAQLARRMYGKYGRPREKNVQKRVKDIESGKYKDEFKKVMALGKDEIQKVYIKQQQTREIY